MADAKGSRQNDLLLAGGVLGILTVLLVPLPPVLLDFLITTNLDRKSTRLNSSHIQKSRIPSSA